MGDQKIKACFDQVDTDKSGYIDGAEVEKVLCEYFKSQGKKPDPAKIKSEVASFIKDLDTDHDGKVSLKEFIDFVKQFD